jgi:hypothetical protein
MVLSAISPEIELSPGQFAKKYSYHPILIVTCLDLSRNGFHGLKMVLSYSEGTI